MSVDLSQARHHWNRLGSILNVDFVKSAQELLDVVFPNQEKVTWKSTTKIVFRTPDYKDVEFEWKPPITVVSGHRGHLSAALPLSVMHVTVRQDGVTLALSGALYKIKPILRLAMQVDEMGRVHNRFENVRELGS